MFFPWFRNFAICICFRIMPLVRHPSTRVPIIPTMFIMNTTITIIIETMITIVTTRITIVTTLSIIETTPINIVTIMITTVITTMTTTNTITNTITTPTSTTLLVKVSGSRAVSGHRFSVGDLLLPDTKVNETETVETEIGIVRGIEKESGRESGRRSRRQVNLQ